MRVRAPAVSLLHPGVLAICPDVPAHCPEHSRSSPGHSRESGNPVGRRNHAGRGGRPRVSIKIRIHRIGGISLSPGFLFSPQPEISQILIPDKIYAPAKSWTSRRTRGAFRWRTRLFSMRAVREARGARESESDADDRRMFVQTPLDRLTFVYFLSRSGHATALSPRGARRSPARRCIMREKERCEWLRKTGARTAGEGGVRGT